MDDLERRIRAARPVTPNRYSPLSPRAERELQELLTVPTSRPERSVVPWPRIAAWASAIAAALCFVLAITLTATAPQAAAAPPLLTARPLPAGDHTLQRLSEMARQLPSTPPQPKIIAETWSMDLTVDDPSSTTFVQPREVLRYQRSDGSGEIIVRAGTIRWGGVPEGIDPPAPGTELERSEFGVGEHPRIFPTEPPDSPEALKSYLESALPGSEMSSGDFFRAIQDLRNEWELTGPQTAAVLDLISTLPDVVVLGEVTDRLDRPGIAIATNSRGSGHFQDLLIFDSASGALIASEDVYLGGDDTIPLDSPSVLNYISWKEPK